MEEIGTFIVVCCAFFIASNWQLYVCPGPDFKHPADMACVKDLHDVGFFKHMEMEFKK